MERIVFLFGNVRLSYSDLDKSGDIDNKTEILEEHNYYPFGLKHKGYNQIVNTDNEHKFRFNDTEFDDDFDLNWYNMPLRHQDPTTGRWNGIDPVTHFSQSTYAGYNNNPVFWADPSGADWKSFWSGVKTFFGASSSGMPKGYGKVGGSEGSSVGGFVVNRVLGWAKNQALKNMFNGGTGWSKKTTTRPDGSKLIEVKIRAGVKFDSKKITWKEMKNIRLPKYKKIVEKHFSRTIHGGKTEIKTKLEWIEGKSTTTGFYVEINDEVDLDFVGNILRFIFRQNTGGRADEGKYGNTQENRIQLNPTYSDSADNEDDSQTLLHELGHVGGVEHSKATDPEFGDKKNFMYGCSDCINISEKQFEEILKNIPEIDN